MLLYPAALMMNRNKLIVMGPPRERTPLKSKIELVIRTEAKLLTEPTL